MSGPLPLPASVPIFGGTLSPWLLAWLIARASGQPIDGDRTAIIAASLNTPGIARKMIGAQPFGGGDLNGSAARHYMGQAGTAGQRIAQPRASAGNYTGVV